MLGKEGPPHLSKTSGRKGRGEEAGVGGKRNIPSLARKAEREGGERERGGAGGRMMTEKML